MTDAIKQYFVIFLIFVLSIAILYAVKPVDPVVPCGIILPAEHILPATQPAEIQLLPQMTYGMQDLGTINIRERATTANSKELPSSMVNMAKQLAASVGANGMILGFARPVQSLETGPTWFVMGKAVYTQ